MSNQDILYYRELFQIFDAYTSPKLMRVMDEQRVPYMKDSKGRPMTTKAVIEKAFAGKLDAEEDSEFPGFEQATA